MNFFVILLLVLSTFCGTGRNIFSKGISFPSCTKSFFKAQSVMFLCGCAALIPMAVGTLSTIAEETLLLALIYSLLLVAAQGLYTLALAGGDVAVCSILYAMGFIIPTVSGCLLWGEEMTVLKFLGILCVIPVIIISGQKKATDKKENKSGKYLIFGIGAMIAAGGLGFMQKIQQKSAYPEQMPLFVFVSFGVAALIFFAISLFAKADNAAKNGKKLVMAGGAGICFMGVNILNTALAGMLDTAIFFPVYNISVILMSIALGVAVFKEKPGMKEAAIFLFSVLSILLLVI